MTRPYRDDRTLVRVDVLMSDSVADRELILHVLDIISFKADYDKKFFKAI